MSNLWDQCTALAAEIDRGGVKDAKALARFLRGCAFTASNWFEAVQEERARADALQQRIESQDAALMAIADHAEALVRTAQRAQTPPDEAQMAALVAEAARIANNPRPPAGKRKGAARE